MSYVKEVRLKKENKENIKRVSLRVPDELHEALDKASESEGRSQNAEMLNILKRDLSKRGFFPKNLPVISKTDTGRLQEETGGVTPLSPTLSISNS